MIEFGLVVARLLHYASITTLAGVAFFPLYACRRDEPDRLAVWRASIIMWAAVIAHISGMAWFAFTAANMGGGSISDMADPETLQHVLHGTEFGVVWASRMCLASVILVISILGVFKRPSAARDVWLACLAAVLLASLAGAGHAQLEEGWNAILHVGADAAHLIAAGAWLGALVPLGYILLAHGDRASFNVDRILMRFSGMGYAAVATLVGTGLINSWFLVGSVSSLFLSTYGQLLLAKLACFAGMLVLAAANRFWLVPALQSKAGWPEDEDKWRNRLRNHIVAEQALGILVLLCVSILGMIRPAIGQ